MCIVWEGVIKGTEEDLGEEIRCFIQTDGKEGELGELGAFGVSLK